MSSGVGTTEESRSTCSLEFGVGQPDHAETRRLIEASWTTIDRCLEGAPIADALSHLDFIRSCADASEAMLLAARLESGASPRSVESLLRKNAKTSKRTAKTRTRRANAVKANPDIGKKLATGELSPDQTDVIAQAAEQTNGAAANDPSLVEQVSQTEPDKARRLANEFVRKHTTRQQAQARYDKARRLRKVSRWKTEHGSHVLALEGDEGSIDRIESSIKRRSDQLYRADGGRDLASGKHPRTRDQRNFDAAEQLLSGNPREGSGASTTKSGRATGSSRSTTTPRATVVVTMTTDQATGLDTSPVRKVGGGILAPSELDRLMCNADFVGQIYNQPGEVLWQGRKLRSFTAAQILALIARDQGCVECGAHYSICEAHHLIPWESWMLGPTDIDNAALLCPDCHHRIHDHDLELYRDTRTGQWKTRPSRPTHSVRRHAPERGSPPSSAESRPPAGSGSKSRSRSRSEENVKTKPRLHERRRVGALF